MIQSMTSSIYGTTSTSKASECEWKVIRYEALLKQQREILGKFLFKNSTLMSHIIKKNGSGIDYSDDSIISSVKDALLPLIQHLFSQTFSQNVSRFNPTYLDEKRKAYHQFILLLRATLDFAERNRNQFVLSNVFSLGYSFYAKVHFNPCAAEIFNRLSQFGIAATGNKKSSLVIPTTKKYQSLFGLEATQKRFATLEENPLVTASPISRQKNRMQSSGKGMISSFDPNQLGYTVFLQRKMIIQKDQDSYSVHKIVLPSPTIETPLTPISINSEMRAFLTVCRENEQSLVYIHCEDRNPKRGWGNTFVPDDSSRCQAIEELAKEFPNTLFYVNLNLTHPFYEQLGHKIDTLNVKQIKETLIAQIFDSNFPQFEGYLPPTVEIKTWMRTMFDLIHEYKFENSEVLKDEESRETFIDECHFALSLNEEITGVGYSIYQNMTVFKQSLIQHVFDDPRSGNLVSDTITVAKSQNQPDTFNLKKWSVTLADHIHTILFNKQDYLTPSERRIFIRFFYNYLILQILSLVKPKFFSVVSAHSADRTVSFEEMFFHDLVINDLESDFEMVQHFERSVHLPAMMACKRALDEKRLLRLLETSQFMLDHKEKIKKLFGVVFGETTIQHDILNERKPSIFSDLSKKEEYRDLLVEHILPLLIKSEEFQRYLMTERIPQFVQHPAEADFKDFFQSHDFKLLWGKNGELPDFENREAVKSFLESEAMESVLQNPDYQQLLIEVLQKEPLSLKELLGAFMVRQNQRADK